VAEAAVGGGGRGGASPGGSGSAGSEQYTAALRGWKPLLVLEVLFIAVWEAERGGEYGSRLVRALEAEAVAAARARGLRAALVYVEIGFEQPQAKVFWGNNGFARAGGRAAAVAAAAAGHEEEAPQKAKAWARAESGAESGAEEVGLGLLLGAQELQFIEGSCLRFRDTEQYAKRVLVCD
jgi:hypothetical protein